MDSKPATAFVDDLHATPSSCSATTGGPVRCGKILVCVLSSCVTRGRAPTGDRRWCLKDRPGQTLLRVHGTRGNPTLLSIVSLPYSIPADGPIFLWRWRPAGAWL